MIVGSLLSELHSTYPSPLASYPRPMHTNDLIIEYSKNPTNKYIMEDPSVRYREHNRVCADVVEVFLYIDNDILKSFSFDGYMSIIATACTAIIGEALEGESLDIILSYDESFVKSLI